MDKTVVGFFETRQEAEQAVRQVLTHGTPRERISVATHDHHDQEPFAHAVGSAETVEHVDRDVSIAEMAGGLAGMLGGASAIILPGVGPLFATGPLATAIHRTLEAMGIQSHDHGFAGTLVDMGVPADDAAVYARGVHRGGVLVVVHTDQQQADAIRGRFASAGARIASYH